MRRNFFCLLILFFTVLPAIGVEESSNTGWGESTSVFSKGFDGQKPVTDNSFQKTVKMIKERALTQKQRKLRKEVQPFSPLSDDEYLKTFVQEQTQDDGSANAHTVMIPLSAYSADGTHLNPGYYRLSCRKIAKDMYVLDLSQGTNTVVSVKAMQTKQDLEQETLSFGNAQVIDNNRIRLIYGTIDLNLVGYLYFK